jgi:hypothetical protein
MQDMGQLVPDDFPEKTLATFTTSVRDALRSCSKPSGRERKGPGPTGIPGGAYCAGISH